MKNRIETFRAKGGGSKIGNLIVVVKSRLPHITPYCLASKSIKEEIVLKMA